MKQPDLEAAGYTFSISSTGYFVRHNGIGIGGVATFGTSTHTSDGRRKHHTAIEADRKMYREEAIRTAINHYRRTADHGN